MPKIIIDEIDNTSAGNTSYNDYVVLIPGPASGKLEEKSKLFSTRTEFVEYLTTSAEWQELSIVETKSLEYTSLLDKYKYLFINAIPVTAASGQAGQFIISGTTYNINSEKTTVTWTPTGGSQQTATITNGWFVLGTINYHVDENQSSEVKSVSSYEINGVASDSWSWESKKWSSGTTPTEGDIYKVITSGDPIYKWNRQFTIAENIQSNMSFIEAKYLLTDTGLGTGLKVLYAVQPSPASVQTGLTLAEWQSWFTTYKDRGIYDIRFIELGAHGGLSNHYAEQAAIECAGTRKDCIATISVDKNSASLIENEVKAIGSSKYAAYFSPKFMCSELEGIYMPASFGYLKAFSEQISNGYSEWFATAGSVRGQIPLTDVRPRYEFGDASDDVLQSKTKSGSIGVNLLREVRPFGKIFWGNRTGYRIGPDAKGNVGLIASNFLNIRQLCCTLNKVLYRVCRQFTFQPNSDILWIDFCNAITPTLERMKSGQGIKAYRILKEETSEKATLKARIQLIKPIEGVEDFDLTVELTDSIEISEE